jgi:predicted AlkP superfamily phosphohydrolase/phosphomutase
MSANNWTLCPQCEAKADKANKEFEQKVKDSYGKVSSEEYIELLNKLKQPKDKEETLREDYEIGTHHGVFEIDYRASCTVCGFTHKFSHSEKVKLK